MDHCFEYGYMLILFRSLVNLHFLDLAYNHISHIPPFMFANHTKLNWLFLDHNNIVVLPENMFPTEQLPPLDDFR